MTTTESGSFSSAALEEYLSLIDELLAQPFPETNFYDDPSRERRCPSRSTA
ncbi:hypothetical protein ABZ915_28630 [Streptomyces sp. NPDC046915]|uniref:hypothetical protein n=1 Tax=Streptomyces sp. NPDC046915 TaxID=3155257 RepID=UPI0033D1C715